MPWVWWALAGIITFMAALAAVFLLRTRYLIRRMGVFECALQESPEARLRSGWASYRDGHILWYPLARLGRRPHFQWPRTDFEILSTERMVSASAGVPVRALTVRTGDTAIELYVHEGSYTGIRSWLEAAPPSWMNASQGRTPDRAPDEGPVPGTPSTGD